MLAESAGTCWASALGTGIAVYEEVSGWKHCSAEASRTGVGRSCCHVHYTNWLLEKPGAHRSLGPESASGATRAHQRHICFLQCLFSTLWEQSPALHQLLEGRVVCKRPGFTELTKTTVNLSNDSVTGAARPSDYLTSCLTFPCTLGLFMQ